MYPDAPYFTIFTLSNTRWFIRQRKSTATQWVSQTICQRILLTIKWQRTLMHQTILLAKARFPYGR